MEKKVDYIIVGLGIAGVALCERLEAAHKSFVVIDTPSFSATRVAGGVINPTVLKRFTAAWRSNEFIPVARAFYKRYNEKLQESICVDMPVHRVFANAQEQNDWMVASDKEKLAPYLSSEIVKNENSAVHATFGYGPVLQTFKVNTMALMDGCIRLLEVQNRILKETFHYDRLLVLEDSIRYGTISAEKIIFAQGAQIVNNPYFSVKGIIPKKGEYVIVKAPKLDLDVILKASYFVIPLGDDLYKVGATFDHMATTYGITDAGKETLRVALSKIITVPFEIVDQVAGMRPTVQDRRPILGTLDDERIIFFNGLGARGLLMAPLLASELVDHLVHGRPISEELQAKRFIK